MTPAAARNARIPRGPRRQAEKSSRPVPASASIWAGFMRAGDATNAPGQQTCCAPGMATLTHGHHAAHPDRADAMRRVRAIIAGSSGNLVEWYDFYVYSFT